VTVPPLSVKIARCQVVRRGDLAVAKSPSVVLMDALHDLPGILVARVVATLNACSRVSSSNVGGCAPVCGPEKSPLVEPEISPLFVVDSNGYSIETGTGECQPECSGGGPGEVTTDHRNDLHARSRSLPVENLFHQKVSTTQI
jgi:hypothetical protein